MTKLLCKILVATLARWPHLLVTVSAVDRTIAAWLKRQFPDLYPAFGAFPIALNHLAGSKSTALVIVSHTK